MTGRVGSALPCDDCGHAYEAHRPDGSCRILIGDCEASLACECKGYRITLYDAPDEGDAGVVGSPAWKLARTIERWEREAARDGVSP